MQRPLPAGTWEFALPEGAPLIPDPSHRLSHGLYDPEKARQTAWTQALDEDYVMAHAPLPEVVTLTKPRRTWRHGAKQLQHHCARCGVPITQRPGRGRPRKFCADHQAPHRRVTA